MARTRAAEAAAAEEPQADDAVVEAAAAAAEEPQAPEPAPAKPRKPWLISANHRGEPGGEA